MGIEGVEWLIALGSLGFTLALVPQAVRTLQRGRAEDVSLAFILLVLGASAATLAYWLIRGEPWYVYGGFVANLVVWTLVLWYRLRPRRGTVVQKPS